jgi:hypothetical protein
MGPVSALRRLIWQDFSNAALPLNISTINDLVLLNSNLENLLILSLLLVF